MHILETCSTVEQAVAFYRGHWETSFATDKTLIADRTGASVIIGAKDGRLQVQKSAHCQGFGYGARTLDAMLAVSSEPTVANGFNILRACRQKGTYATKYSNIYDLKSGNVFLFPFPTQDDMVKLNLAEELRKGGHYYDMLQIKEQMRQPLRPLRPDMERGLLEKYHPIADTEPKATEHLRRIIEDAGNGTMQAADYTEDAWKSVAPQQEVYKWTIKSLGPLASVKVADRNRDGGNRNYRYRLEFKASTVLLFVAFDGQDKLISANVEDTQ